MLTKSRLLKLFISLGANGILCIICLASVGVALVTYNGTVATTPTRQLTVGTIDSAWTVYVNEINQVRYVPGVPDQFTMPTLDTDDVATYSFSVVTDANKVCAVKVGLTTAMDAAKFSKFDITVYSSTGDAWSSETLYSAATGTTTKAAINGLIQDEVAYIHQAASTTKYYEVKVTYSYDQVDNTAPISVDLQLIPFPRDNFT
jgi:hypothetical protein